jgi:hypothetical protein
MYGGDAGTSGLILAELWHLKGPKMAICTKLFLQDALFGWGFWG